MAFLFFDIGETLAHAKWKSDGTLVFMPRHRVFEVLDALPDTRKGIISDPGSGARARTLAAGALASTFGNYFTEPGLIHWGPKRSREIFDAAVASAAASPGECVFIGEDADERRIASEAGMRTVADPLFARAGMEDRPVFWIRIAIPEGRPPAELNDIVSASEVVPVHVGSPALVLAMATAVGIGALEQGGFSVDLRGPVGATSAYLMRDDRPLSIPAGFAGGSPTVQESAASRMRAAAAFSFISRELTGFSSSVSSLGEATGGVYIAAYAGTPVEELHIPGARHGHTERLLPDAALLLRPGEAAGGNFLPPPREAAQSAETKSLVEQILTEERMRKHIARFSGAAPLEDDRQVTVRSRDVGSGDNALVVEALTRLLALPGLSVQRHEFPYRGTALANVEAEYSVAGSDGAVLVSAHLDSTAIGGKYTHPDGRPRSYDPATDPAPGADDDASGMAAVIGAAQCLQALLATGRRPRRTMRFVLFNAEEQGLVGSKAYARAAAAAGEQIAGVLQLDMIAGYQGGRLKAEIHAGSVIPGPAAQASVALGQRVAQAAESMAPGFEIQRLNDASDPAIGRSDHASFQERGWPAIVVSENFFADTEPGTGTPQYHQPGDILSDPDHDVGYATAIARAVTLAALTLAGL